MDDLRRIEAEGEVVLASGQVVQHPKGARLPTPWTGIRIQNLSPYYIWVGFDRRVRDQQGFLIREMASYGGTLDLQDIMIREHITLYCASAATVYITGFNHTDPEALGPETVEGSAPVRIAEDALVRDPEFSFGPEFDDPEPPLPRGPRKIRPWHRRPER